MAGELQPLLPSMPRGLPRVDDRRVISDIVHVLQSGCRWNHATAIYGPPKALYNSNVRWAAEVSGGMCSRRWRQQADHRPSTHFKAHRSAAGGKGGAPSGDREQPGRAQISRST